MVVLLLVELSRREGAFPSLRWLAEHLGCSTSSVRAAIREAEQLGIVRRAERFDQRAFSGGRQTSNSYEIALHPGLEQLHDVAQREERELVIVDDESDPNQLELRDQDANAPARPTLAAVGQRSPLPTRRSDCGPSRAPLHDSTGGPSEIRQGIKDPREKLEEKANSTGARDPAKPATDRERAAAFLVQILPAERAKALKQRFGAQAFGSLLFALRRKSCVEHPTIAARALERLEAAQRVTNPGGYFVRILQDELAAAELLGSDAHSEPEAAPMNQTAALVQRIQALNAELACLGNVRRRDALYRELNAAQDTLRHLVRSASQRTARLEPAPQSPSTPADPPTPEIAQPSRTELSAELELLRETRRELVERLERVQDFDGEATERLRREIEGVKVRGREVLALLDKRPPDADPGPPLVSPASEELSFSIGIATAEQEAADEAEGMDDLSAEDVHSLRAALLVVDEKPTALGGLHAVGERDVIVAETLEKLGAATVLRRPPEAAFRPLSQEELELSRRLQRAALLAIREREASGAVSWPSPLSGSTVRNPPIGPEPREICGPGLAKVDAHRGVATAETTTSAAASAA